MHPLYLLLSTTFSSIIKYKIKKRRKKKKRNKKEVECFLTRVSRLYAVFFKSCRALCMNSNAWQSTQGRPKRAFRREHEVLSRRNKLWLWAWCITEEGPHWILTYVLLYTPGFSKRPIMIVLPMSQWQKNYFDKFAFKKKSLISFYTASSVIVLYIYLFPFSLSLFFRHSL